MEIKNYKSINKGCLQGSFQIYMPAWGITIRDCKHFKKGESQWVQLPARQYEMDGQTKNYEYLFFDEGSRQPFLEKVLSLIQSPSQGQEDDFNFVPF